MRIAIAGVMAVVLAACTATPGATVIVEHDRQSDPVIVHDEAGPPDAGDAAVDANADDASTHDAGTDADAGKPIEPCARLVNYDPYCADPDAGFGSSKPYAYDCAPGDVAGEDCSLKNIARVWCCTIVH